MNPYNTNLPPDLRALKEEIEGYARGYGLDFFETIFEVIDADDLNEIAAYGGFPTRYPHWSFGMSYEELRKGYDYGLSKIYEMVINNDPCYAYLMRSNHTVDQKLVMAHVYGHCDFFKNNAYFAHTSRKMMDEMANHGARIRRYVGEVRRGRGRGVHGPLHVDRRSDRRAFGGHPPPRAGVALRFHAGIRGGRRRSGDAVQVQGLHGRLHQPARRAQERRGGRRKKKEQAARNFPEQPEKDVLLFLVDHAPLKGWQRDVLEIVRDEAYYFAPQGMTKILNEGWACICSNSYVFTDCGCPSAWEGSWRGGRPSASSDGESLRRVYDWAKFENRETVRVQTRRGLEFEGSVTHQLLLPDGSWRRLDEFAVGDRVAIGAGPNVWAEKAVALDWKPEAAVYADGRRRGGGCGYRNGHPLSPGYAAREHAGLAEAVARYDAGLATATVMHNKRQSIRIPEVVDESSGGLSRLPHRRRPHQRSEARHWPDHRRRIAGRSFRPADGGTVRRRAAQEVGPDEVAHPVQFGPRRRFPQAPGDEDWRLRG